MAEAIEFYSRYLAGQVTDFPPALQRYMWEKSKRTRGDDIIRYASAIIKRRIWDYDTNESSGIGRKDIPEMNLAYEIYKMIRKFFYDQRDEEDKEDYSVDQYLPLSETGEDFIEVTDD